MILSSVCHFINFYRLKALALFALENQYHLVLSSKKSELYVLYNDDYKVQFGRMMLHRNKFASVPAMQQFSYEI